MKLPDLIAATRDDRVTPRFVRFLIAEKIIPSPAGGRAHAEYGSVHLTGIARYLHLRDLGLSITAIKRLEEGEAPDAIAVNLAPGITLSVRPAELGTMPDVKDITSRIAVVLGDIMGNQTPTEDDLVFKAERTHR